MDTRVLAIGFALLTAACGSNVQQRVATGALTGGIIGAAAGGPVGLGIGVGAGATAGWLTPMGADQFANGTLNSLYGR